MSAQSNNKRVWQIEIVFKDTKPPHLYMMTSFSNNRNAVVDQVNRQIKWFKPETIESVKAVQYKLDAVDEINYTHLLATVPQDEIQEE